MHSPKMRQISPERSSLNDIEDKREIIIRNIPESISTDTVELIFLPFNQLGEPLIASHRGFRYLQAHIAVVYLEDAEDAVERLNGKVIDGHTLEVDFERPKDSIQPQCPLSVKLKAKPIFHPDPPKADEDGKSLIVTNIDPKIGENELKLIFLAFKVVNSSIVADQGDEANRYGIVNFESEDEAQKAITCFMGKMYNRLAASAFNLAYSKKGELLSKSFCYIKDSKNHAFITYLSLEDAEAIVNVPSGKRRFVSFTLEFEWDK
ncbi:MAG: hypothetical protein EZS28_033166 [Streblomastix strix]|uniref:RRM domain-containing protein n=1 Tax=Streblomastix strix TaxID=222440 RepID=A0A5J4ULL5_9EUKA|nr:MAG: hypothetical protein EZS28_033166 [Streblomastix strix]